MEMMVEVVRYKFCDKFFKIWVNLVWFLICVMIDFVFNNVFGIEIIKIRFWCIYKIGGIDVVEVSIEVV